MGAWAVKEIEGHPRNANATAQHRVILIRRFLDTIQALVRQPTSILCDTAPTSGFTGQRGVCFCGFVNGIFAQVADSFVLLWCTCIPGSPHNPICTYCCNFAKLAIRIRSPALSQLFRQRCCKRTFGERIRHTPPSRNFPTSVNSMPKCRR